MQQRTLGKLGIAVSPIMLGGNVFGWTVDEPQSFEILDRFVERGFNFIDTAKVRRSWADGSNAAVSAHRWCWRPSWAWRWVRARKV